MLHRVLAPFARVTDVATGGTGAGRVPDGLRDLRADWEAIPQALAQAGLRFADLPAFLVLGLSLPEEERFFAAAHRRWTVVSPRAGREASVRAYADAEAVFLVTSTAGALAAQRELPPETPEVGDAGVPASQDAGLATLDPGATAPGGGFGNFGGGGVLGGMAGGPPAGGFGAPAGGGDAGLQTLDPGAGMPGGGNPLATLGGTFGAARPAPAVLDPNGDEGRRGRSRLAALCDWIAGTRGDGPPLSGVLLAMPLNWTDPPRHGNAERLPAAAGDDLDTVGRATGTSLPVSVVFTGLEQWPGARELINRGSVQNAAFRDSRAGTRFPPGRDLTGDAAGWALRSALAWFRGWTYASFSPDPRAPDNRPMYRLVSEMRSRTGPLAGDLETALDGRLGDGGARLTGVYFSAAGRQERERAFVQGILKRMEDTASDAAWTPARLAADRRRTALAWVLLLIAAALLAGCGWLVWRLVEG